MTTDNPYQHNQRLEVAPISASLPESVYKDQNSSKHQSKKQIADRESALYSSDNNHPSSFAELIIQAKTVEGEKNLLASGRTGNLLARGFSPEWTPTAQEKASPVEASRTTTAGDLNISIKRPIKDGEHIALAQTVDYKFRPTTAAQKQWQAEHPNGPELGHIVHVHFRARSGGDKDQHDQYQHMQVELRESQKSYYPSMRERVDLGKSTKQDKDGYTTYDLYAIVPDTKIVPMATQTPVNQTIKETTAGPVPIAESESNVDWQPNLCRLKFNITGSQQSGQIDIKDLKVQEVSSAPDLDPNDVVKAGRSSADGQKDHRPILFGTEAFQLSSNGVPVPDEIIAKAAKEYPDQPDKLKEMKEKYQQEHALTPIQQEKYIKLMKEMGINSVTIPIYWNQIETPQGKPDYEHVDNMIAIAKKYGMQVKLHPIVWGDCCPKLADKTNKTSQTNNQSPVDESVSETFNENDTKKAIQEHIDEVIEHFGKKVDYFEVNEMNSTDLLQQYKVDNNRDQLIHNGLTDWVAKEGPTAVINQVDQWINGDFDKSPAKLLVNECITDDKTKLSTAQVSHDSNHPIAFGIQEHQFEGNHPALRIAKDLQDRAQGDIPAYISEITAQTQTQPGYGIDENHLSPEVKQAINQEAEYRLSNNLKPLTAEERQAQEAQAEQLLMIYKLAARNKNTMGISLWDFTDKNSWRHNTGGVLDDNLDPKISYFTLKSFIGKQ